MARIPSRFSSLSSQGRRPDDQSTGYLRFRHRSLGLIPHLTDTGIGDVIRLTAVLTDDPLVRWAVALVYAMADQRLTCVHDMIDASLEITPVDAGLVSEIRTMLEETVHASNCSTGKWFHGLRELGVASERLSVTWDAELHPELCRLVLGAHLALTESLDAEGLLQECASWGGLTDFRCAVLGGALANGTDPIGLWHVAVQVQRDA